MFPHEAQEEINWTRDQAVSEAAKKQSETDAANDRNRLSTNEQSIPDLQAQLDALRLQSPEDDPRIEALENRIEALKKDIN